MILKIPLLGWFSTRVLICAKCKQPIGHYVEGSFTEKGAAFHDDCHMDYVAEKEGWSDYRERYKNIEGIRINPSVQSSQALIIRDNGRRGE